MLRKLLPESFKNVLRFFRYSTHRQQYFREIRIKKIQNKKIIQEYSARSKKLIVFIAVGADRATGKDKISGGAISIVSLCQESKGMIDIHGSEVIMCTWPNDPLFLKHTRFENHTNIFRFNQLSSYFQQLEDIIIHIPEFMLEHIINTITVSDLFFLKKLSNVHINIMNQNIQLMPKQPTINKLLSIIPKVTITTAHQQYCTLEYRTYYQVPIHKLSVWISPEQYHFKQWQYKKDIMVISPDEHPLKAMIIDRIKAETPINTIIIKDLTYEQYKALISDAKWSLTFGEGLDGYFIEPIFSGAISFAVFNEHFFTAQFKNLQTVYPDYATLANKITNDLFSLNSDVTTYESYQKNEFDLCAQLYSYNQYRENIVNFYKNDYTFK